MWSWIFVFKIIIIFPRMPKLFKLEIIRFYVHQGFVIFFPPQGTDTKILYDEESRVQIYEDMPNETDNMSPPVYHTQ